MKYLRYVTVCLLTLVVAFKISTLNAQSLWVKPLEEEGLGVEWLKYMDESDSQPAFLNSAVFVKGKKKVSSTIYAVGELPISHYRRYNTHTTIGNIYLGAEWYMGRQEKSFGSISSMIEAGIRLPTLPTPEYPDSRGYVPGRIVTIERSGAFIDSYIPTHFKYNFISDINDHIILRLRAGFSYWIFQANKFPQNVNAEDIGFLHYGGKIEFQRGVIFASVGYLARNNVSDDYIFDGNIYRERSTVNETSFQIEYLSSQKFKPGIYLKLPSDNHGIDTIYGITAEFTF